MNQNTSGITAAKGYQAIGLRAGIKAGKTNKDMALVYSEAPAVVAGTFTRNLVSGTGENRKHSKSYCGKQRKCQCLYRSRRI